METSMYQTCTQLLHSELRVAMGCTEPIALSYCAAYARKVLGAMPERYELACSGSIIKNVKAVTVPNTGGMKGIPAAILAGAISGRADLGLEILTVLTDDDRRTLVAELAKDPVQVSFLESCHPLHIRLQVFAGKDTALVEIIDTHTNIGEVRRNGELLHQSREKDGGRHADPRTLTVRSILEYADTVDLTEVREVLQRQIVCNSTISQEGMRHGWGECVGQTLQTDNCMLYAHLKAVAAAGSDARMNGCPMPVVINSGSGNQGLTASLPVIEYAKIKGFSEEKLLRALCVSNLVALHQKAFIGTLSAYCGVVCAATGSAAGIAYLDGQDYTCIANTIINSICTIGGMVCDGAKSSCAAKIAAALDAALTGYEMAKRGRVFRNGEGLVKPDVEQTIACIGALAAKGMAGTNAEIVHMMM